MSSIVSGLYSAGASEARPFDSPVNKDLETNVITILSPSCRSDRQSAERLMSVKFSMQKASSQLQRAGSVTSSAWSGMPLIRFLCRNSKVDTMVAIIVKKVIVCRSPG